MAIPINQFGFYEFDNLLQNDAFTLTFENLGNSIHYRRFLFHDSSSFDSILSVNHPNNILIQPSEPIFTHLNKVHLLIKFSFPLSLFPESKILGYSLFPIAITTLINNMGTWLAIDTFSTKSEKYALYGTAHNGVICHYKESVFTPNLPEYFDKFSEGILRLEIINTTKSFVRLNQIVLDYSFIKLFYNDYHTITQAAVKILGPNTAETEFVSPDFPSTYSRTIDLIPTGILTSSKFLMEFGL